MFKPVELFPQVHDFAHNDDGRGFQSFLLSALGNILKRTHHGLLLRNRPSVNQSNWGVRRPTVFHEAFGNLRQIPHTHEEHQGPHTRCQFIPRDARCLFGWIFVPRDKGNGGCVVAVGQWNTGIGRYRDGGSHARDNLEGNTRFCQFLGLFPTPAKDKGVAAFEPDHP